MDIISYEKSYKSGRSIASIAEQCGIEFDALCKAYIRLGNMDMAVSSCIGNPLSTKSNESSNWGYDSYIIDPEKKKCLERYNFLKSFECKGTKVLLCENDINIVDDGCTYSLEKFVHKYGISCNTLVRRLNSGDFQNIRDAVMYKWSKSGKPWYKVYVEHFGIIYSSFCSKYKRKKSNEESCTWYEAVLKLFNRSSLARLENLLSKCSITVYRRVYSVDNMSYYLCKEKAEYCYLSAEELMLRSIASVSEELGISLDTIREG